MTLSTSPARHAETAIVADPVLPAIRITRDFRATPAQVMRAHTDPDLFARWIGPASLTTRIEHWDCRDLGSYRYLSSRGESADREEFGFRGTFPRVTADTIVQTFSYDQQPDSIALERITVEDVGEGYTRLHVLSLCESFEARDAMLRSGMGAGIDEGYAKLADLLSESAAA